MNAIKINVLTKLPEDSTQPCQPPSLQLERGGVLAILCAFSLKLLGFFFSPSKFLLGFWCGPICVFISWEFSELACVFSCLLGAVCPPFLVKILFSLGFPHQLHLWLMEYVLINHPIGCKRNMPANPG